MSYRENFSRINFLSLVNRCPHCKGIVVCHGAYFRKKAGVLIQRFKCVNCGRTFGFLPPFLLPHKHYTVSEMAPAIEAYALGRAGQVKTWSASGGQETAEFSLETFRRWVACFRELSPNLLRKVRKLLAAMKPGWKYEKDRRLFKAVSHPCKEELYQLFVLRDYFTSLITAEDYLSWLVFLRSTRFEADGRGLNRENEPCLTGRQARAGPKRR